MKIDLSSLEKAIASLSIAIIRAQAQPGDDLIRDGVIQRFEYTYDWFILETMMGSLLAIKCSFCLTRAIQK